MSILPLGEVLAHIKRISTLYLGVAAREKIPIVHPNWKAMPKSLKNLICDDILVRPLKYLCFRMSFI